MVDLTIDELAQQGATKTSTVRLYQTKGLLPPPEVRGRVGYYSQAHLARLRVIDRLQQRGFSLAAIKELLESWANGGNLESIVDPHRELAGDGSAGSAGLAAFGEPAELTPADFAALFPDGEIDLDTVARAGQLGLVAFDEETGVVRVPSRAFLEIGRELAAYRVPAARSVDEFEQLSADARRIAERFVGLVVDYVITPSSTVDELTAVAQRLRALAGQAVQELVTDALDQLITEALAGR
jgi:DNA-binding transcriptional MerR regulator